MKKKLLIPLLAVFAIMTVLVGPARVHVQAHYPSDVAAGYLLAAIWLLVIIPVFVYLRGTRWMSAWKNKEDPSVVACESCKVASSIASVVVLDPDEGTATKVYLPPPLVRILYWDGVSKPNSHTRPTAPLSNPGNTAARSPAC